MANGGAGGARGTGTASTINGGGGGAVRGSGGGSMAGAGTSSTSNSSDRRPPLMGIMAAFAFAAAPQWSCEACTLLNTVGVLHCKLDPGLKSATWFQNFNLFNLTKINVAFELEPGFFCELAPLQRGSRQAVRGLRFQTSTGGRSPLRYGGAG